MKREVRFAMIFDMDGVIVDSELHWNIVEPKFFKRISPHWPGNDYGRFVGLGMKDIFRILTDEYQLRLSWEEFIAEQTQLAKEVYEVRTQLLPGFLTLFETLKKNRVPTALASSAQKDWVMIVLRRFKLKFDVVVSTDDVGGVGKPNPILFLEASRRLKISPDHCVVIEDSENGIEAASRAGMISIGLENGFSHKQDLSTAHKVVNNLGDITLGGVETILK